MFELEEQANNLSLMQAGVDQGDTTAGSATAYRHGGCPLTAIFVVMLIR